MIEVQSRVKVYEVDGKELKVGENISIDVISHWSRQEFIIFVVGNEKFTVARDDIEAAICNASNTAK